jgi:integrase/recombinase XerD
MGWAFHNRINTDGTQAVVYQVNYLGERFTVLTGVKTKKVKTFSGRIKGDLRNTLKLQEIETIIITCLEDAKSQLPYWTEDQLKTRIRLLMQGNTYEDGRVRILLKKYWEERIDYYRQNNKLESARHNEGSLTAIFKFLPPSIHLDELTRKHLREIVDHLSPGRSSSSVAGYLRDLRALINIALLDEVIIKNPFIGFRLPKVQVKKDAGLTLEELKAFSKAPTNSKLQELIKDMAMFRYYSLGMRYRDQILLKPENLNGDILTYITSKNKKRFQFKLHPEAFRILEKWKSKPYLFPVLKKPPTPTELSNEMIIIFGTHNTILKKLAKRAGITKKISTHTFRHTFNYINDHLSLTERQTALGHSSQSTTENYSNKTPDLDHLINQIKI